MPDNLTTNSSTLIAVLMSIAASVGSGFAVFKAFVADAKRSSGAAAADKRMTEIAERVMNPDLQRERHEQLQHDIHELVAAVSRQSEQVPAHVQAATLAGVQAGYQMIASQDRRGRQTEGYK